MHDVTTFGAVGDGVTDDTLAIQAALDAVDSSRGGTVCFPPLTFKTTAPLRPKSGTKVLGPGYTSLGFQIVNTASNIFDVNSKFLVTFEDLSVSASAGHLLSLGNCSFVTVHRCNLRQDHNDFAVIHGTGIVLDSMFENLNVQHKQTATVPTFYFTSSQNAVNCNVFRRMRMTYSGNYSIWIENTAASGYCSDNIIESINFEVATGGCVKLLSCFNTTLRQCAAFDFAAAATTRDLFYVGKSATGPASRFTRIDQCGRRFGGNLPTGIVDIRLQQSCAWLTTIAQCDTVTMSGFSIDAGKNQMLNLENMKLTGVQLTNLSQWELPPAMTKCMGAAAPTWAAPDGTVVVGDTKIWSRVAGAWKSAALQ